MHQAQQLAYRLGHFAAAFIAGAAALRYADTGPEFLLIHTQAMPDVAGVGNSVEWSHGGKKIPPRFQMNSRTAIGSCEVRKTEYPMLTAWRVVPPTKLVFPRKIN